MPTAHLVSTGSHRDAVAETWRCGRTKVIGMGVASPPLPSPPLPSPPTTTEYAGSHPAVRLMLCQRTAADNFGNPRRSHSRFGSAMLIAGLRLIRQTLCMLPAVWAARSLPTLSSSCPSSCSALCRAVILPYERASPGHALWTHGRSPAVSSISFVTRHTPADFMSAFLDGSRRACALCCGLCGLISTRPMFIRP